MLLFFLLIMSKTIDNIAFLGTAVLITASCAVKKPLDTNLQQNQGIPRTVLEKYEVMEREYPAGRLADNPNGVYIKRCIDGNNKIFMVMFGGSYSGETHFYNQDGKYLGSQSFSDVPPYALPPKPPFNLKKYECTTVMDQKKEP